MKKLTLRKTIEFHREMWSWLAANPYEFKENWPRWKEIREEYGPINSGCFACHYNKGNCFNCPFDWTYGSDDYSSACVTFNEYKPGLYTLYCHAQSKKERIRCATKIATLQLKLKYKLMYIFMPWR